MTFTEDCALICPGFRADGDTLRARKAELLPGTIDGAPVIAKRVGKATAVWAWYFAREIAIYRAFAAVPPELRVPRLIGASEHVLILERLPGAPLGARRNPDAALAPEVLAELLEMRARFARYTGVLPDDVPSAEVRSQLRQRLLEDPTSPVDWIRAGVARSARRGVIPGAAAIVIDEALTRHAPVAPCHGDLVLRNVIGDGTQLGLVDWECAGPHVEDWDLALLWTQLAPASRPLIEETVHVDPRWRTFLGLVAFALAREISFLRGFGIGPEHAGHARLVGELAVVCGRLVA